MGTQPQVNFKNVFTNRTKQIKIKGIKAKDGVVIAVEKKLNSILVDENSY